MSTKRDVYQYVLIFIHNDLQRKISISIRKLRVFELKFGGF
ncbi:unnamed protein product, partial [Brassica oleracea]